MSNGEECVFKEDFLSDEGVCNVGDGVRAVLTIGRQEVGERTPLYCRTLVKYIPMGFMGSLGSLGSLEFKDLCSACRKAFIFS